MNTKYLHFVTKDWFMRGKKKEKRRKKKRKRGMKKPNYKDDAVKKS